MNKRILTFLACLCGLGAWGQGETNLQIRVDVPDSLVDKAKIYMNIVGETNATVRQWLATNVIVALPSSVESAVETRKQDMANKILQGNWDFIKTILNKFGY